MPKGFRWPNPEVPVAFIPVRHGHESNDGMSKSNAAEVSTLNPQPSTLNPQPSTLNPQPSTLNPQVDEVLKVANSLIEGGLTPAEIGIVSPYAAQVRAPCHCLIRVTVLYV